MNAECEIQLNYVSDTNCDTLACKVGDVNWLAMRRAFNPWRIVRADGVVIASSYDGFTSLEQAVANGRTG